MKRLEPERVRRLFDQAIGRPVQDRRAYLDEQCGNDAALRQELHSLLSSHDEANEFLETAILPAESRLSLNELERRVRDHKLSEGQVLGPYCIRSVLGEGGMGTVYLADQSEPVARRVAIKIVKPGMDTREVLSRFQSEIRALALMSHPGIARVHDAGTTAAGRPYFVMEYVPGCSIHEFADEHRLDLGQRLGLFLEVCDAVQHAHQRGILHRDLKPSNILITTQNDRPLPVVIDFGVSKALRGERGGGVTHTHSGALVGTLEYMSPEQANPTEVDIDTRSDIYSLGVVLHELLVGVLPYEVEEFQGLSPEEIGRRLGDSSIALPSTAARYGDDAATRAERRALDPKGLSRELRGDLDWIILRAIATERARRYASASELAADIRRYLDNEPVLAGPPSPWYRLRKSARKHRVVLSLALTVAAVLLVCGALMLSLVVREDVTRQLLDARVDDIRLLSIEESVDEHGARADEFWPALPAIVPDMEEWLGASRSLIAQLPEIQVRRERAAEAIARLGAESVAGSELEIQRFLLEKLDALIGRLRALTSTVAEVEARRALAIETERVTLVDSADVWSTTIEEIADRGRSPQYHGLVIEPQIGLLPIGRDPHSRLFEFAHYQSGDVPTRDPETGQLQISDSSAIIFVLIPGGEATIGIDVGLEQSIERTEENEIVAWNLYGPIVRRSLDPYFISKYEMTQSQWVRTTGDNPSRVAQEDHGAGDAPDLTHPIESVSFVDCTETLGRLGLMVPTEAQWEWAARGGARTYWPHGSTKTSLARYANLADQQSAESGRRQGLPVEPWNDGYAWTAPVGSFEPNAFGLHDVIGNVFEWCRDVMGTYHHPYRSGTGEIVGDRPEQRVVRGGGFDALARVAHIAFRNRQDLDSRMPSIGVRPSRQIDGK